MAHRVYVGLSGGVDSAVSAALLKERGLDVCGVFIKIWRPEFIECTWKEDRIDAMRVCAALSIPYHEIDLSEQYKKEVIDGMIREYALGITPNPDVLCNRFIKFGAFAAWARTQGADLIATGHYARIRQDGAHLELLRGSDPDKDQSYFLCRLEQHDLARTIFPVGGMKKSEVRERASALGLPVAQKRDSQGLCFVGDVSMADFLRRFISLESGSVIDTEGREIGEHQGAALYTVGERHGFLITAKSAARTPHYIVRVDTEHNVIVVSPDRSATQSRIATVGDLSWVYRQPASGSQLHAQARYREKPFPVKVHAVRATSVLDVESDEPRVFPPGQSLVLYRDEVCLGGGVIRKETSMRGQGIDSVALSPRTPVRKIIRKVQ